MDVPMWIDGEPVETGEWIARENPARPREFAGRAVAGTAQDVERALSAARRAFPAWGQRPLGERVEMVRVAFLDALAEPATIGTTIAAEVGKVRDDAIGEVRYVRQLCEYYAAEAPRLLGPIETEDERGRIRRMHRPFGVVAAITAWNAPVILASLKAIPALMAGNAVVLKPSPLAPLAVTGLLCAVAARLPAGVLQVVHGDAEVGEALVSSSHVDKISFTGGVVAAGHIARSAAARLVPTLFELGGNDAALVLPDASLDEAMVERILFGAYLNSGQVCMAVKRVFVPEQQAEDFVERMRTVAARTLRVGDPQDPASTLGPVITRKDQRRLERLIASAEEAGGVVHRLGTDHIVDEDGYWVHPTLVTGLPDAHSLVCEEQFGPVLPVQTYTTVDEAIERINAVPHALGSSVWSADEEAAVALAPRLRAGFTFINSHNRSGMSLRAPFGGVGISGNGKEFGPEGLASYSYLHVAHTPHERAGGANAYPVLPDDG